MAEQNQASGVGSIQLVKVPHPALFEVAETVVDVARAVEIGRRMIEIMLENNGVGLAANQVGIPIRLFVAQVDHDRTRPSMAGYLNCTPMSQPMIYINPQIEVSGRPEPGTEGCLSDPGARVVVKRAPCAVLEYLDTNGSLRKARGFGLLARVWQHEIDHLNGKNIRAKKEESQCPA